MKILLSTVLLAYLVLGAWAQNKTKMTEEEKKEAMEQLEVLYQFETGAAFGELDSLTENQEFKQERLPWEEWAGKFKYAKEGLPVLLRCFNKAFIEPNKDSPIFCNLMLRGKRLCQNADTAFFYAQSPDFLKPGLCYYPKFSYL